MITESNDKKIQEFVQNLKGALEASDSQSQQITHEVRSDIEAHVESLIAKGHSEDEAVEKAIDEMGNPFELAHHMKREVPPFGGHTVTVVRYVIASLIILWTLFMLWGMRAGTYGFSATLVSIIVLLHLPAILLIWPRIVWRRNFLFGLIPAGLVLIATFVFAFGGVETETTIQLPVDGGEPLAQAPLETNSAPDPRRMAVPISIGLGAFSIVLLLAMQQRSQQRTVILALIVGAGTVETIYQVEEALFRRDQKKIDAYLEAAFQENGAYPTREEFDPSGLELTTHHVSLIVYDGVFTYFWARPLSHGHSIVSSSNGDSIRVQD